MQPKKNWLDSLHSEPAALAIIAAILLAIIEVFLDWNTWIQLNVSIVYSLPLVLAAAARNRRLLWGLTALLIILTFVVYSHQIPPAFFSLDEPFFINRLLSAVTMVLTAGLLHAWTLALDALKAQREAIQAKNEQLEAVNRELVRCEEEITRQNEELKQRRDEAEQASKRKTQLLASVSHDIRTPVNAIYLIADALHDALHSSAETADGEAPELAQNLQKYALSLVKFVSDVLDIASFDTGRISLHESEFCLNELLADECGRLRSLAQSKGLVLALEMPELSISVRTDRIKLIRILDNLVTNAIKFTEAGSVRVTAVLTPEWAILIAVADTGIGMDSATLERLFDESAQLRDSGRDRQKGWGLGLAICRRLVTLMGGEISVESQPSCGSTFKVSLPASCVLNPVEMSPEDFCSPRREPKPT